MPLHTLKPCAIVVSLALSSFVHAQDKVEDKWFPELPKPPATQPNAVKKTVLTDMPSVTPYTATTCTGDIRSFETPGVGAQQKRKDHWVSSDVAGLPEPAPGSGFVVPGRPPVAEMRSSIVMGISNKSEVAAIRPSPAPIALGKGTQSREPLRAGFVDDNVDYSGFQAFLTKKESIAKSYRLRDVSERHGIDVRDARGRPIQGAIISMNVGNGETKAIAVSDVNGKAWVFPKAVSSSQGPYSLTVQVQNDQKNIQIAADRKARTQVQFDQNNTKVVPRLDLSIVIDTTGSMSDEIQKLQRTLTKVVGTIEEQGVDVCLNVTAYRDVEDAYILKGIDFTSNLEAVQTFVNDLRADGGGDEPEALNEALEHVVNKLSWRKQDNVVRSVMLITDAPPKMNTNPVFYDRSMLAAGAHGVRVHSVGTSGLNVDGGELVLRQIAQYTGGKFVFLTYKDADKPSSGAGDATVHSVQNYSVDTLDALLLRLVKDDLGVTPSK